MSLCLRVPAGRLSSRRAKMSGSARPRQSARPRDNPSQRTCNNARTRTCDNANSEQSCELVQGNAHAHNALARASVSFSVVLVSVILTRQITRQPQESSRAVLVVSTNPGARSGPINGLFTRLFVNTRLTGDDDGQTRQSSQAAYEGSIPFARSNRSPY